jgi:UDP-2-acetamido-2-deoxy-ribo-hexuluronate aminotransferase
MGKENPRFKMMQMDKIKMVDLRSQYVRIKKEVDDAIENVLTTTAFIQGPEVEEFAKDLASYTGAKFVIPCANGTDALQIAMMALDFKPGDEIILPVHTYVATAEVIALLRLTPVFVDVDEKTFNINVNELENKITNKTVAIVPVHLYGQCADMDSILQIAAKHKLHVIEDAAQSLSADYIGKDGATKKSGTMGTIGATSFFPSKNLGCFGDGGALFTNDGQLAAKIKMISNHGQKIKYHHEVIGVNSRLDTLQAAILKIKLKYLDEYSNKRRTVASYYNKALAGIAGIELPAQVPYSTHVFNQYTVKITGRNRDDLKNYLAKEGIPTMIYYPVPLHLQNAFRRPGIGEGAFPVTENLSKVVISLPIHTEMSDDQVQFICNRVKDFFNQ